MENVQFHLARRRGQKCDSAVPCNQSYEAMYDTGGEMYVRDAGQVFFVVVNVMRFHILK